MRYPPGASIKVLAAVPISRAGLNFYSTGDTLRRAMRLSEPQTIAIINAIRPLQEHERAALLAALVALLAGRHEVGDGELGRMLARLQRDHFRPPTDAEVGIRDFQYRHMDGRVQAHIGTDFFREMRQRHAVIT